MRAANIMHGKTSMIKHNGLELFDGIPDPFEATRYHSLVIDRTAFPDSELDIIATAEDDGEIMGVRHKRNPVWGVQFHPESILTGAGKALLKNFLKI